MNFKGLQDSASGLAGAAAIHVGSFELYPNERVLRSEGKALELGARYAAELAAQMHAAAGDARARYYSLLKLACNSRDADGVARAAFDAARQLEDPAWPARLLTHGALTEGALLMNAGDFAAARSAYRRAVRFALTVSERRALESGAELQSIARRVDGSKLCSALDAMAFLACIDQRYDEAVLVCARADLANELHGQPRQRPVQDRLRRLVLQSLAARGIDTDPAKIGGSREPFDEQAACALALGLTGLNG